MKLITPVEITDSILVSSNVPETDHPAWVSGTTYTVDQRVIYQHNIYQRLIAGAGTTPPSIDTVNWVFVSATNRWKMFDKKGGSQTDYTSPITVTLSVPNVINSVALLLLSASTVRVKMIANAATVYDTTVTLTSYVSNMWEYFFIPPVKQETVVFTDLPQYANSTLEITITNSSGNAKVGSCIVGLLQQFGNTQYGASVGIQSYSIKQRDSFGNINIISRAYNDKARFNVRLLSSETDRLKQVLTSLRDTPVLYIGSELFTSTTVYGFYKDFDIVLTSFPYSDCSIEVEGLV